MQRKLLLFLLLIVTAGTVIVSNPVLVRRLTGYGAPPYVEDDTSSPFDDSFIDPYTNWKRPDGPLRVGLQAGHWKTKEMPEEQARVRDSGGGTSNGKIPEWQVNLNIAEETARILREKGIVVDVLPATVPVDYWADVFISIHADGSLDKGVNGYKVAAPRRDRTGKANRLVTLLEGEYGAATGMRKDPNVSKNMTGYYAFNWRRYDHAVHPMTVSAIMETGFLTNYANAQFLINSPEKAAAPIAAAIIKFLNVE